MGTLHSVGRMWRASARSGAWPSHVARADFGGVRIREAPVRWERIVLHRRASTMTIFRLTFLSNVVAYACRPCSRKGSAYAERILRARHGKGRMPSPLPAGVVVPELVEMMTPRDF